MFLELPLFLFVCYKNVTVFILIFLSEGDTMKLRNSSFLHVSLILLFFSFPLNAGSKKVAVIGTGYVGLIVGSSLADMGHKVTCVDIIPEKIEKLKKCEMPIFEPGLQELTRKNLENMYFTTDTKSAIENSEIIIIAVGTPTKKNYESDLRALNSVARVIGDTLKEIEGYRVVCIKSTVPLGTNNKIKELIYQYCGDYKKFDLVSNPEFLRAGSALKDLYEKNPIVIGSDSQEALEIMAELYDPLVQDGIELIKANEFATTEIAKYAWNGLVAVKVSYGNDLSHICIEYGADIFKVIKIISFNDKVLPLKNVKPGPGLGGSCLPKDTRVLIKMAKDKDFEMPMIQATINSSKIQKKFMVKQLYRLLQEDVKDRTIGVLGLSFKANTDDIRKSPAIKVIGKLLADGAKIKAYDPKAIENMKRVFPHISYCENVEDVAKGSDGLIALTDWNDIKGANLQRISKLVKSKILVDARNMYDPKELKKNGFKFANLGRR